jgi:hypothetical protein
VATQLPKDIRNMLLFGDREEAGITHVARKVGQDLNGWLTEFAAFCAK